MFRNNSAAAEAARHQALNPGSFMTSPRSLWVCRAHRCRWTAVSQEYVELSIEFTSCMIFPFCSNT